METTSLLKVKNLSIILNNRQILENITFDLHKEDTLAIIGPNGAGKSVLLKSLIGLIEPTSGTIEWAPKTKIGYLPQRLHLDYYLPMTVGEFLDLKPAHKHSSNEVAKMVNMEQSWLKKNLAQLSGGELQKVLLAWAVIDDPQVLLFDEPTENVDVVNQASIYHLLHELQDKLGVAIVIISHDLNVVYRYANRVICLNQKMICAGETHETLTTEHLGKLYQDHTFFHHHHYQENHNHG